MDKMKKTLSGKTGQQKADACPSRARMGSGRKSMIRPQPVKAAIVDLYCQYSYSGQLLKQSVIIGIEK